MTLSPPKAHQSPDGQSGCKLETVCHGLIYEAVARDGAGGRANATRERRAFTPSADEVADAELACCMKDSPSCKTAQTGQPGNVSAAASSRVTSVSVVASLGPLPRVC
ncbi:hypothetical protein EYF80_061356 [Liparis tanakae]|uniref:Uncharacterized protein n=1 Tax=Liparis tanakae TaxID=230148 RepID=A0A4Z2EI29_9TELE|nr:hypothetical protein EYF80_061356 [Liparis tanakae]